MRVRAAAPADLPGILTIYNDVIARSTAVYALAPVTLGERTNWFEARQAQGYPVLVAVDGADLLGFSSFGDWRAWPGYRFTVEHSVYVAAACQRRGVGRQLVEALFPIAARLDKHVMLGGIDAANAASIAFHRRLGFKEVAHFEEVGHKFGRWLDLVFMQRLLDAPGARRAA
jgi:phosphinothricin acetyltransferase